LDKQVRIAKKVPCTGVGKLLDEAAKRSGHTFMIAVDVGTEEPRQKNTWDVVAEELSHISNG